MASQLLLIRKGAKLPTFSSVGYGKSHPPKKKVTWNEKNAAEYFKRAVKRHKKNDWFFSEVLEASFWIKSPQISASDTWLHESQPFHSRNCTKKHLSGDNTIKSSFGNQKLWMAFLYRGMIRTYTPEN